jgi:hypothetical protein
MLRQMITLPIGRRNNDLFEMTVQFIFYLKRFQVKDGFL